MGRPFFYNTIDARLLTGVVGVFEEFLSQPFSNRSGLALADRSAVNLNYPDDFGGRAREEELVANIQIAPCQILLDHFKILFLRQPYHQISRNPFE